MATETLVPLTSHRCPSVRRAWAKVLCYVASAFVANVCIGPVRESTRGKGDERTPAQIQAEHFLRPRLTENRTTKSSSVALLRTSEDKQPRDDEMQKRQDRA